MIPVTEDSLVALSPLTEVQFSANASCAWKTVCCLQHGDSLRNGIQYSDTLLILKKEIQLSAFDSLPDK